AFVPGQTSVASTAPLYTLLLSVGYLLHIPFFVWTFALSVIALAGAGWIGRRVGARLFPDLPHAGLWSGLVMVASWHLIWAAASGMETMLFCTLSLVVVWLGWQNPLLANIHHRDTEDTEKNELKAKEKQNLKKLFQQGFILGLVGAALTLTRPEGIGLVGLTGLFVLVASLWGTNRAQWSAILPLYLAWAGGVISAWVLGVAPYLALNYDVSGTLLPDTSRAKQAEYAYVRAQWSLLERYGRLLLPLLASGLIALLPGVIYGIYDVIQRVRHNRHQIIYWLPLVWAVMLLSAYAIRLPANYQHGRYVIPILPPLLLYGVGGTLGIMRAGRRSPAGRVASRTLALSAVLITPGFWVLGAQAYARDVRIINTEMVETAQWIDQHLDPDDLLAVHDIGAVGYYAPRPIFDLAGLVSPDVVPVIDDHAALMQMMCARAVRYLMVFPDQRPAEADDPRLGLTPIFQTESPYAAEAGGANMMIYEMNWSTDCN
ncbi:MAG: hypothetical protein JXA10_00190, partial [Anaerolineae bacterium]|nr:hypothetical protein [Anaerolineae bacterium]